MRIEKKAFPNILLNFTERKLYTYERLDGNSEELGSGLDNNFVNSANNVEPLLIYV
jgi:hypothetical protein